MLGVRLPVLCVPRRECLIADNQQVLRALLLSRLREQVRSVFLWGDARVHGVALRTAARTLAHGLQVAIIDAGVAVDIMPIVAMAKACRIAPDVFLRRVHLVRAFTCWQLTTLLCD